MFVLKEMLPGYHKWRYNSHGVREQIGKEGGVSREDQATPGSLEILSSPFSGCGLAQNATAFLCLFWSLGCLILELIHAILNLCHEADLHGRYKGEVTA